MGVTVHQQECPRVHWYVWRIYGAFVIELLNWKLYCKCIMSVVSTILHSSGTYYQSTKPKKTTHSRICFLALLNYKFTLKVCPSTLDTPCMLCLYYYAVILCKCPAWNFGWRHISYFLRGFLQRVPATSDGINSVSEPQKASFSNSCYSKDSHILRHMSQLPTPYTHL
jgi:hypothetical protein